MKMASSNKEMIFNKNRHRYTVASKDNIVFYYCIDCGKEISQNEFRGFKIEEEIISDLEKLSKQIKKQEEELTEFFNLKI